MSMWPEKIPSWYNVPYVLSCSSRLAGDLGEIIQEEPARAQALMSLVLDTAVDIDSAVQRLDEIVVAGKQVLASRTTLRNLAVGDHGDEMLLIARQPWSDQGFMPLKALVSYLRDPRRSVRTVLAMPTYALGQPDPKPLMEYLFRPRHTRPTSSAGAPRQTPTPRCAAAPTELAAREGETAAETPAPASEDVAGAPFASCVLAAATTAPAADEPFASFVSATEATAPEPDDTHDGGMHELLEKVERVRQAMAVEEMRSQHESRLQPRSEAIAATRSSARESGEGHLISHLGEFSLLMDADDASAKSDGGARKAHTASRPAGGTADDAADAVQQAYESMSMSMSSLMVALGR
jgi:hypothetical protein